MFLKNLLLTFTMLTCVHLAFAQEDLADRYEVLIESTETYEQFKVIPKSTLDTFWAEVTDSLNEQRLRIAEQNSKLAKQQTQIDTLTRNLTEVRGSLQTSLAEKDSIRFLGIDFSKLGYHIMVWVIILVLAVLAIASYFMFSRSNKVTIKAKRELETLQLAFEEHKNQAREKQVKLKRELQTAVNQLDELKRGRN